MLNEITLQGRFTHDLELKTTKKGTPKLRFSLAVERDRKEDDGTRKSDFIPCVVYGKSAEFVETYFKKGDMILISGRLGTREWMDEENEKHKLFEVIVKTCSFCNGKKADGERKKPVDVDYEDDLIPLPDDEDDYIPF